MLFWSGAGGKKRLGKGKKKKKKKGLDGIIREVPPKRADDGEESLK